MKTFDTHYTVVGEMGDTTYRLSPNPDAEPGTGFKHGAVLEWKDSGADKWLGYFFIEPGCLAVLADMLEEADKQRE